MSTETYDVIAVNIQTGDVRIIATQKDQKNAEAIVRMAVMRRGVDEEFFAEVPSGKYSDGNKWAVHP